MRQKPQAFTRYCPRFLTLIVCLIVGVLIALANLNQDRRWRRLDAVNPYEELRFDARDANEESVGNGNGLGIVASWNTSYGWPLLWRQSVGCAYVVGPPVVLGECFSASRLAGDVAMWLTLLAASAGASEWLTRRYKLRFRWGLRTMLSAVVLSAACCGWFAAVRNRANAQDAVFATRAWSDNSVLIERWGPRWPDVVGADRYCRRIVGVVLGKGWNPKQAQEHHECLIRLKRLPELQYLFCAMDPALSEALPELR